MRLKKEQGPVLLSSNIDSNNFNELEWKGPKDKTVGPFRIELEKKRNKSRFSNEILFLVLFIICVTIYSVYDCRLPIFGGRLERNWKEGV